MAVSLEDRILRRIRGKPLGWVFTAGEFRDLGSNEGIRKALQTICDRGRIRRLARGLYDNPQHHPKLGLLWPTAEQIVEAISRKEHTRIQPTGAYAANLLGLSTQVPARIVFLTDGSSKRIVVGKRIIQLKHREPSSMIGAGKLVGLFIQALKLIGRTNFNEGHFNALRRHLSNEQIQQLNKDIRLAPAWIADVIRKLHRTTEVPPAVLHQHP